ncbi:MAG: peptidylprolyl isomerase [Acidimicrobiia bacterium]
MSKQSKRDRQRENREARRQYEEALARRRRTFKTARLFAIFLVPVIAIGAYLSISAKDEKTGGAAAGACRDVKKPKPKDDTFAAAEPTITDTTKTYVAEVVTSCGSFTIQLAAAEAPETVNSFAFLANEGFYDSLTFHRLVKDFVIQGGDPKGDGTGGPGYTVPDEPPTNGYQEGSVAMANSGAGTTGSQFFVVTTAEGAANLGGPPFLYSILGQVTEGFETVLRIEKLAKPDQQPKKIVVIDKVTVTEVGATAPSTTTTTSG